MNIYFTVNKTEYNLQSTAHDFALTEVTRGKDKEGRELESLTKRKYFSSPFEALRYIPNIEGINSEATTFLELKDTYVKTLDRLDEIADQFGIRK